ncbi:MAG: hypothetical protein V4534_02415 [Myxococcota bacterium]
MGFRSAWLHEIYWNVLKFEVGYWLRTSKAGQGVMTETVDALTLEQLEIHVCIRG